MSEFREFGTLEDFGTQIQAENNTPLPVKDPKESTESKTSTELEQRFSAVPPRSAPFSLHPQLDHVQYYTGFT